MRDLLSPTAQSLNDPKAGEILRAAVVTAVGFGIYGLTVGLWRAPLMGVLVAI